MPATLDSLLTELQKHTTALNRLAAAQETSNQGLVQVGQGLGTMINEQRNTTQNVKKNQEVLTRLTQLIR